MHHPLQIMLILLLMASHLFCEATYFDDFNLCAYSTVMKNTLYMRCDFVLWYTWWYTIT